MKFWCLCINHYIRETKSYRKIGGRGVTTEGQGEDGAIQFGGKGRYRRASHLAEIENREQFHICALQKPVLCKMSIFPKLKQKLEVFF